MHSRFLSALAVLVLLASVAYGRSPARDPKKEQLICNDLAAVAPGAVQTFRQATEAMDKDDYSQAVELYREVTRQAPTFTPGLRRLGMSLAALGQTDEGLTLLENAVKIERSPENLVSLAEVLDSPSRGTQGSREQRERALSLAKEAAEKYQGGDDPSYFASVAHIALGLENNEDFRGATERLVDKYPNFVGTHYYNAYRLAMAGSWIAAEDEIRKAERLGLPREVVQEFLATGVHTRATAWRWAHYALYALAAWACGLGLLFVSGKIFSRLTLRFIEESDPNSGASGAEATLRRYYRGLINVAGSYYYFSIPFVILLVLAVTGSIVYGFLMIGEIPVKLVLILVVGALVTIYKMVHSLFVKVDSKDPGRSLRPEEAPGFWKLTREVAEDLGTRPLDEIRIVPGTEMAVYERGSYRERRKDMGRRVLVMGLGLLQGFDQDPFRAVLAHEYGHLSHRDTAGGDVALRVNQDMVKFAYAMVYAGQAVWWNVAFHFLRLYLFLFRRISHGATRLQEVLADRAAARIYGARPFEEGLRHVVRRHIEFKHFTNKEIKEALRSGAALQNVYALEIQTEKPLEEEIDNALNRQTSEDDTHPSPVDRFRLVSRVVCQNQPVPSVPVWSLFTDREAITKEMSSEIERMVKATAT